MSRNLISVPYTSDDLELAVKDGVATIANQRGFVSVGWDGSNYRFFSTNASGQQVIVGAGVAGTPAGGVASVQGVAGGTALPVSAASLPLPTGAATEATLATLLTEATFTARVPVNGQALMAASIPVVIASNQSAIPITDNAGSITIDTTQLPAALVGARLDTNIGAWLGSTTPTVGQKAMTASIPVTFASDQSALPVTQSGAWTIQQGTPPWAVKTEVQLDYDTGAGIESLSMVGLGLPASGGVVAGGTATDPLRTDPTGTTSQPVDDDGGSLTVDTPQLPAALVSGRLDVVVGAQLPAGTNNIGDVDVLTVPAPLSTTGGGTEATALRVTLANDSTGLVSVDDNGGSLTVDTPQLPAALVGARLDTNVGAWMGATTPTVGQKAMAASIPVVLASDQTAIPVGQSGTWTVQQGTPPWAVAGTDADGAAPTENPVLTAGYDGANVQTKLTDTAGRQRVVGAAADGAAAVGDPVQVAGVDGSGNTQAVLTETDGSVRTRDDFIDDRDKVVGVSYVKLGVAATTYYMLIDLSNLSGGYPHANTTGGVFVAGSNSKGVKTNSGAKWAVEVFVITRIDGTDADIVAIPGVSFSLRDTSTLSLPEQIIQFFPIMLDLTVSAGALVNVLSNFILLNVAAINTAITLEDAGGNNTAPAVGDVIIKAELVSGGGTLDFAMGMQYFVE